VGAGAAGGAPGAPHWPGFAGDAAGWSQLGEPEGGTTTVGAIGLGVWTAMAGGAQVEATPALWAGEAGRTGGADFLRLRRLRTRMYRRPATSAVSARIMYAYSTDIRWRASLAPFPAVDQ
jgi:hypothetical protein